VTEQGHYLRTNRNVGYTTVALSATRDIPDVNFDVEFVHSASH
jgi:hypothetical protein